MKYVAIMMYCLFCWMQFYSLEITENLHAVIIYLFIFQTANIKYSTSSNLTIIIKQKCKEKKKI